MGFSKQQKRFPFLFLVAKAAGISECDSVINFLSLFLGGRRQEEGDVLHQVSKWPYNPYKWPYKWVAGVITLLIGAP